MLVCEVLLIVFIVGLTNAQSYIIPEPKIEVYRPRGFSVSIEDSPGVRFFAFHCNVNRELENSEAGQFSKEIVSKQNGRWTFEDHSVILNVGDTINYWLYVMKDRLGYRFDNGVFTVKELISRTSSPSSTQVYPMHSESLPHRNNSQIDNSNTTNAQALPSSSELPPSSFDGVACEESILNITRSILALQTKIEDLTKTNQQLTNVLDRCQDARKLTLSGRIPPDGEAAITATFILREKLDLNPDIVFAKREGDTIIFEVATLAEKLQILDVASEKLNNSKITISY